MPRDGKGRPGDSDGEGGGDSDGVCDGDGVGDSNGLGVDDRDGSGYVASDGNNAGEQVMVIAMATRTATATATATGMVGDGMLTAMMAMAGYGDVVAKTRTYLHRQLEFFLSDTSCWIQKNTRNSSTYIHRNEY